MRSARWPSWSTTATDASWGRSLSHHAPRAWLLTDAPTSPLQAQAGRAYQGWLQLSSNRLAMLGHTVTMYDARPKPGGLYEYGIAQYKTPHGYAQAEVDWLMKIGGITLQTGKALGRVLLTPKA